MDLHRAPTVLLVYRFDFKLNSYFIVYCFSDRAEDRPSVQLLKANYSTSPTQTCSTGNDASFRKAAQHSHTVNDKQRKRRAHLPRIVF